jgi:aminoglycoside/choline kinase family phosphotransferase
MTAPVPSIADAPDALTPEWLTAALRSSGCLDGTVIDTAITPVGTGQMCDSVRIALTYDSNTSAPASLVAKLPAADETSRATAVALRNYEKEVRFYQELAPLLDVRTPLVFHAALDPSLSSFVLLLEDLAPATVGDQISGCTVAEAHRAIAELTRLHAPRWGDTSLAQLPWLVGTTSGGDGAPSVSAVLPLLWAGFQERHGDKVDATMRAAGDHFFGNLDGWAAQRPTPRTITHGDYRLDNLLFHPDRDEVAVVDWQTCALGPGAADAAYFVGAGLVPHDRRAHEDALVLQYHSRLVDAGVDDYTLDDCWTDYRRGAWSGVLMAVGAAMMVERTDRGDTMFLTMLERHAHQVADLDAATLIEG